MTFLDDYTISGRKSDLSNCNKYDVFISCKREDYVVAEVIYKYLRSKGVSAFIASEDLRRAGNTDYLKEIDNALSSCKHMIVFISRKGYADSNFVQEEWQTFRNEKLSGRKQGNLLTVIGETMKVNDLPIALRSKEVIRFEEFENKIMYYLKI